MTPWTFKPIGIVRSAFKEKFGIPRQPGLVATARGEIVFEKHPFIAQSLAGLEGFSHLWVIWVFHRHDAKDWKPSIRPPRLGGAQKVGVLASRSPHRPNPIGLSAVKIERVLADENPPRIEISGVDLLDGTPVLDIKPYLPYADSIPHANAGWADAPITTYAVSFSPAAETALARIAPRHPDIDLHEFVSEMLSLDPRPAFQSRKLPPQAPEAQGTRYGITVLDFDVKWEIRDGAFVVLDCVDLP